MIIRLCFLLIIFCLSAAPAFAKKKNPGEIPPEAMEQMKKMLPPGVQLPPGFGMPAMPAGAGGGDSNSLLGSTGTPKEPAFTPVPDSKTPESPFGSGRSIQQREAAVALINVELDRMPFVLPILTDTPTTGTLLQVASDRNAFARKKFSPEGLSAYSRSVTWVPRFDGKQLNQQKARDYSLLVSAATNYFSEPYYIMALASAVFALDPQSPVNANNFASAVVAAGERLHAGPAGVKDLGAYRREAEAIYCYALAISIRNETWGEESFTPILNLGNLYIDMGKLEEARSLFQVARKLKPFSWDAARGMAAYFHAIGQPTKALAILEDPKLDKPSMLMVAKKASKVLEKTQEYAGLPIDTPPEKFAEGIKLATSEPIATAADFVAQLDQSERNKMRYFVEHLPPEGSFSAPKITKLTQYASAQAISSPQGRSAVKEFGDMLSNYAVSSSAAIGKEQLKMLSRLGIDMNLGIDLDDVAKNPQKYTNKKGKNKIKPKIDKSKLLANLQNLKKQAKKAENELATGKTGTLTEIAASIDPFNAIVAMNPEDYADPMNVIIQKHNYAVHNRKVNLYNGYLYSINKRILQNVMDIQKRYGTRMLELETQKAEEIKEIEARGGSANEIHGAHVKFFNGANAAADTSFGSATNVVSVAYVQKIKPMAEAYYYDVIRHVGLISDSEVRDAKDAELKRNINSALVQALSTVMMAHGSFRHYEEWECGCSKEGLAQEREAALEEREREEEARRQRNLAGKAAFDSKDIPPSTPLWKKLDSYGTDLKIPGVFFLSGRISCARTEVRLDTSILPFPNVPQLFGAMTRNEITGATKYDGGVNVQIVDRKVGADGEVKASIGLSGSVSTDGNWNVKDYSVSPSGQVSVKAGETTWTAKAGGSYGSQGWSASGEASMDNGKTTVSGSASVSGGADGSFTTGGSMTVKSGQTEVTVKGEVTYGPNGEVSDSDFSAGINQDLKNGFGTSGKVSFEASTKRGCTMSGEVTGSIMPSDADGDEVDKSPWENIKDTDGNVMTGAFAEKPVTDKFHTKNLWSGKFCTKKEQCEGK